MKRLYQSVCGIDVHQHMLMCSVVKYDGGETNKMYIKEVKNFSKGFSALNSWMKRFKVERVVLESTGIYWNNLYDYLFEKGYGVDVVNAYHVKNVPGRKTDVLDAQWLAELGMYGLVSGSFIPSRKIRSLRLLARYRAKTVYQIASEKKRMLKVLEFSGIRLTYAMSKADCVSGMAMIKAIANGEKSVKELTALARGSLRQKTEEFSYALSGKMTEDDRFVLKKILEKIEYLEEQAELLEKELFLRIEPYKKQWQLIQTIPGFDELSAALLIAEIGNDVKTFKSKERFCSWLGLCPSNNQSAGKKKSSRIRKANVYVKSLAIEVANAASKTTSQFQGKYKSLVIRRGHKRSIVAIGHKLMGVVFSVLKNETHYKDPKIDYEKLMTQKNASRWVRMLKKYGHL